MNRRKLRHQHRLGTRVHIQVFLIIYQWPSPCKYQINEGLSGNLGGLHFQNGNDIRSHQSITACGGFKESTLLQFLKYFSLWVCYIIFVLGLYCRLIWSQWILRIIQLFFLLIEFYLIEFICWLLCPFLSRILFAVYPYGLISSLIIC